MLDKAPFGRQACGADDLIEALLNLADMVGIRLAQDRQDIVAELRAVLTLQQRTAVAKRAIKLCVVMFGDPDRMAQTRPPGLTPAIGGDDAADGHDRVPSRSFDHG